MQTMSSTNEGGIKVPLFKGPISLANVQKFLTERLEYVRRVEEYNIGLPMARKIKIVTLPAMIDQDVLRIMSDNFMDGIATNEITAEKMEEAFQKVTAKYSDSSLRDWKVVFKDVRMSLDSEDPIERVSSFQLKYEKAIREHAMQAEMKDENKFKLVVEEHLLKKVVPQKLKIHMDDLCKYDKQIKRNKVLFFKKLEEEAIAEGRAFQVLKTSSHSLELDKHFRHTSP